MSLFLQHIKHCNQFDASNFLPFYVAEEQMGWTAKSFAYEVLDYPSVFEIFALANGDEALRMNTQLDTGLDTVEARTDACHEVMWTLHKKGVIDSWVGEQYAVTNQFDEPPRFLLERAAVSFLGVRGYGVHINGLVQKADGLYVWVGKRTTAKPFWPGKLDQMVAGGQPAGTGLMENVIKESQEEANIPAEVAATADYIGALHYRTQGKRGLHTDTLFNYDLWLDETFVPENTDGEVEEFILMPIEELASLTDSSDAFKDNCNLVNIDLLLRKGVINESHPDYQEIHTLLYQPAN